MATNKVRTDTYAHFKADVNGKAFDMDGYYGYQCWDGMDLFWVNAVGRTLLTGNGEARGCWLYKRSYNAGSDFTLITNWKSLKKGDIVVLNSGAYGHIAMVDSVNYTAGTITLLGQNQVGNYANGYKFTVTTFKFSASKFLGAFRYKKWHTAKPTYTPKKGDKVTITATGNARPDGKGATAYGIGWQRYVLAVDTKNKYPYKVGAKSGSVTGYYKATALKKA